MIITSTLFLSGLSTLASSLISVWQTLNERHERCLDREHQRILQTQQHQHEYALKEARALESRAVIVSAAQENTFELDINNSFFTRLRIEAEQLFELGFAVIYEPIGTNYGLALPMGDHITFGFLLSSLYPYEAPVVLLRKDDKVEQIDFGNEGWQSDILIADIVKSIITVLVMEFTSQPASNDQIV